VKPFLFFTLLLLIISVCAYQQNGLFFSRNEYSEEILFDEKFAAGLDSDQP
jgi:hypothetical protein